LYTDQGDSRFQEKRFSVRVELERERQARIVGNQKAQEFHQNPPPQPAPRTPRPRQKK